MTPRRQHTMIVVRARRSRLEFQSVSCRCDEEEELYNKSLPPSVDEFRTKSKENKKKKTPCRRRRDIGTRRCAMKKRVVATDDGKQLKSSH